MCNIKSNNSEFFDWVKEIIKENPEAQVNVNAFPTGLINKIFKCGNVTKKEMLQIALEFGDEDKRLKPKKRKINKTWDDMKAEMDFKNQKWDNLGKPCYCNRNETCDGCLSCCG